MLSKSAYHHCVCVYIYVCRHPSRTSDLGIDEGDSEVVCVATLLIGTMSVPIPFTNTAFIPVLTDLKYLLSNMRQKNFNGIATKISVSMKMISKKCSSLSMTNIM